MATYKQIQVYVKNNFGFQPKTCWIAHMKELCGLNPRISSNRRSLERRTNPCPKNKQESIRAAFRHFSML